MMSTKIVLADEASDSEGFGRVLPTLSCSSVVL